MTAPMTSRAPPTSAAHGPHASLLRIKDTDRGVSVTSKHCRLHHPWYRDVENGSSSEGPGWTSCSRPGNWPRQQHGLAEGAGLGGPRAVPWSIFSTGFGHERSPQKGPGRRRPVCPLEGCLLRGLSRPVSPTANGRSYSRGRKNSKQPTDFTLVDSVLLRGTHGCQTVRVPHTSCSAPRFGSGLPRAESGWRQRASW